MTIILQVQLSGVHIRHISRRLLENQKTAMSQQQQLVNTFDTLWNILINFIFTHIYIFSHIYDFYTHIFTTWVLVVFNLWQFSLRQSFMGKD